MVRFLACAELLLLAGLTGCAGAGASEAQPESKPENLAKAPPSSREANPEIVAQASPRPSPEEFWRLEVLRELAELKTPDAMRVHLSTGFTKSELHHVGFDLVTIAECVDRLAADAMEDRARGDQSTRDRLMDTIDLYLATKRETMVRRHAGAATCLPYQR